jgi:hypothetical protein
VHLIGKISGAKHFTSDEVYIKYFFKIGDNWKHLSGKVEGETFQSKAEHGRYIPLEHPIDINFSAKSVRGWPKLLVEVWEIDHHGRNSLAGYSIVTLPFEQGEYKLELGIIHH